MVSSQDWFARRCGSHQQCGGYWASGMLACNSSLCAMILSLVQKQSFSGALRAGTTTT
jgi:hypothetical protein